MTSVLYVYSSSVGGSQNNTFQHPGAATANSTSQFQQQFLSFAQSGGQQATSTPATVNGGSPSLQADVAMLRHRATRGKPAAGKTSLPSILSYLILIRIEFNRELQMLLFCIGSWLTSTGISSPN